MEVKIIDKLLYRPVVNTVYMKPNRRLGRIIGINGNLIFCIEQEQLLISVKTSDQFIRNCSNGAYKIITHVNDSREWTRPLSSGCNKLIISKEGNVFLANKVYGIYHNTIFECNTNEGKACRRSGWNGKGMFIVKQVPSHITSEIIPNIQSLPQSAKDILMKRENPHIDYTNQMLIINPDGRADSWIPSSSDVFAEDWEVVDE